MPIPRDDPVHEFKVFKREDDRVQLKFGSIRVWISLQKMKIYEELQFTSRTLWGVFTPEFFDRLNLLDPANTPTIEACRPAVLRMAHYIEDLWQTCPFLHNSLRAYVEEYKFFAKIVAS